MEIKMGRALESIILIAIGVILIFCVIGASHASNFNEHTASSIDPQLNFINLKHDLS
jgi:hypothetical protein